MVTGDTDATIKEQLKEVAKDLKLNPTKTMKDGFDVGEQVQLTARSNKRSPNDVIFILPNGKIAFPSADSIPCNIGDVVKATVIADREKFSFITVNEIIHKKES